MSGSINATFETPAPPARLFFSLPASLLIRLLLWVAGGPVAARLLWWHLLSTVIGHAGDLNANPVADVGMNEDEGY